MQNAFRPSRLSDRNMPHVIDSAIKPPMGAIDDDMSSGRTDEPPPGDTPGDTFCQNFLLKIPAHYKRIVSISLDYLPRSKKNEYFPGVRKDGTAYFCKTAKMRNKDARLISDIQSQCSAAPMITEPAWIDFTFFRKNKRQDGQNIEETIYDALQSAGVIKNDRLFKKRTAVEFNSNRDFIIVRIFDFPTVTIEI